MTSRVLTGAVVAGTPASVSRPSEVLGDATRALLEREVAAAHARGLAEGRDGAMGEARAETAAVRAAVDAGVAALRETMVEQHAVLAAALAERVVAATAAVLGHEPDDGGQAVVARLQAAIARVDDPRLEVRVGHAREFVVREALAGRADVEVVTDDTLQGDDVVVTGAFAQVDLRRAALLAALDEVLADEAPLGPISASTDGGPA